MKLICHAKINLGLSLLAKREDGFHELETLMHEVDLCDELLIAPSAEGKDSLVIEGQEMKVEPDNLLFKTLSLSRQYGYDPEPLTLKLIKRIPIGGGLGGGSSNAIALLRWLAEKFEIPHERQHSLAAQLGSDTNFFIEGGTALCRGRGEKIEAMPHPHLCFNLILPKIFCSTPVVFSKVKLESQTRPSLSKNWLRGERFGHNDLEAACCLAYPEMEVLLNGIRKGGVEVFLSGSGSTLYTVHQDEVSRDEVGNQLKEKFSLNVISAQSVLIKI